MSTFIGWTGTASGCELSDAEGAPRGLEERDGASHATRAATAACTAGDCCVEDRTRCGDQGRSLGQQPYRERHAPRTMSAAHVSERAAVRFLVSDPRCGGTYNSRGKNRDIAARLQCSHSHPARGGAPYLRRCSRAVSRISDSHAASCCRKDPGPWRSSVVPPSAIGYCGRSVSTTGEDPYGIFPNISTVVRTVVSVVDLQSDLERERRGVRASSSYFNAVKRRFSRSVPHAMRRARSRRGVVPGASRARLAMNTN